MRLAGVLLCWLLVSPWVLGQAGRPVLNPDVSPATLSSTICVPGYTRAVRPGTAYTNAVKKRLMAAQGLDFDVERGRFELDHVVPLALGGHPSDPANLALQPWDGPLSARRKDRLEVKLQCLVCSGALALDQAREEIWADWDAAFGRYGEMACRRARSPAAPLDAE
jgi:hypothetical protein